MTDILVFTAGSVAVIVALVQAAKNVGLDSRWAPLLAIILGVVLHVAGAVSGQVTDHGGPLVWFWAGYYGIIAGLSAAGIYSGWKATTGP